MVYVTVRTVSINIHYVIFFEYFLLFHFYFVNILQQDLEIVNVLHLSLEMIVPWKIVQVIVHLMDGVLWNFLWVDVFAILVILEIHVKI